MKRLVAKKLTLHKQTLRRLTRDMAEQQLIHIVGGTDQGPMNTPEDTIVRWCPSGEVCTPCCTAALE